MYLLFFFLRIFPFLLFNIHLLITFIFIYFLLFYIFYNVFFPFILHFLISSCPICVAAGKWSADEQQTEFGHITDFYAHLKREHTVVEVRFLSN